MILALASYSLFSWKVCVLGGALWVLYFWGRLRERPSQNHGSINLRSVAISMCRLVSVLLLFALLVCPPGQWIYFSASILWGTAIGLTLTSHFAREAKAQLRMLGYIPLENVKSKISPLLLIVVAIALVPASVLAMSTMRGLSISPAVLLAGIDGVLFGWSLFILLWARRLNRQGLSPLIIRV
jgi:hypothetical protein